MPEITFITIKGNSVNKIIEQEEFIGDKLNKDGILYFSLAQFLPSAKRQVENRQMVKDLYQNNLDNYAKFLDLGTQNSLKKASLKNDVQDFTKNNKNELESNGVIIEFIDKRSISTIKQFYDLIIFDNIDDIDDSPIKKPYGISIYTSEKLMIEDELKSLNKIFLNKVNELIAAKEQINIAERKLKQYLNGKNVKR